MHGPIYGAQKAAIDKMAFDMAYDLKPFDICSLSLWSGIVKDEKTQKVSEQHEGQYAEFLKGAASQVYAGMVINEIYKDPEVITLSGKTLIAAEIGERYEVKDVGLNSPKSDRESLGGPRDFSEAVVY
jgi:NAD(P)-dependent dehydrogenase (short-subunit alcohol dehydrogenase family)